MLLMVPGECLCLWLVKVSDGSWFERFDFFCLVFVVYLLTFKLDFEFCCCFDFMSVCFGIIRCFLVALVCVFIVCVVLLRTFCWYWYMYVVTDVWCLGVMRVLDALVFSTDFGCCVGRVCDVWFCWLVLIVDWCWLLRI